MFVKYVFFKLFIQKKAYSKKNPDKSYVRWRHHTYFSEFKKYIEDTTCIQKLKFVFSKSRKPVFYAKTAKKAVCEDVTFDLLHEYPVFYALRLPTSPTWIICLPHKHQA